jgi:hypothetical protein
MDATAKPQDDDDPEGVAAAEFDRIVEERFAEFLDTGLAVSLDEAAAYLRATAAGRPAVRPVAREILSAEDREELRRRLRAAEADPSSAIPWEEVRKTMLGSADRD